MDVYNKSKDSARDYLLNYLMNLLGFKEFGIINVLKSCEYISYEALIKEKIDKFLVNESFILPTATKKDLDYYCRINQSGIDGLLALFLDDNPRSYDFLCVTTVIYSFYRRKYQEKKFDMSLIFYSHKIFTEYLFMHLFMQMKEQKKLSYFIIKLLMTLDFLLITRIILQKNELQIL